MHWKNFLYFSSAEKITILILLVLIVLSLGLNNLLSNRNSAIISISQNDSLVAALHRLNESLEDKKVASKSSNYKPDKKSERDNNSNEERNSTDSYQTNHQSEKTQYIIQEKFTAVASISLNETDTAQWKMVPGIGSAFSARIIKYRNMLGGYISIHQLKEVYGVTDELFDSISPFIRQDDIGIGHCVKLNINKLEFKEILAHPYIDFEQTKAIVNLRRRIGDITSTKELAMLDEFTAEDIARITPYIDF